MLPEGLTEGERAALAGIPRIDADTLTRLEARGWVKRQRQASGAGVLWWWTVAGEAARAESAAAAAQVSA